MMESPSPGFSVMPMLYQSDAVVRHVSLSSTSQLSATAAPMLAPSHPASRPRRFPCWARSDVGPQHYCSALRFFSEVRGDGHAVPRKVTSASIHAVRYCDSDTSSSMSE